MNKRIKAGTREAFLDAERGTIRKDWKGRVAIALAYPNTYTIGMSNLGFQSVYRLINGFGDAVCERVFAREEGKGEQGPLVSIESGRPLADFDIIAFSISFENDYPNVVNILEEARLPLWSPTRSQRHPLVVAGGVTSLLNPEAIASFVDCFLIGEAECLFPPFFETYKKYDSREARLEAVAADVPGAYVPAFYDVSYADDGTIAGRLSKGNYPKTIARCQAQDFSAVEAESAVLTPHTTFDDTYLIEAARGCIYGCRFCAAGYVYRPPRVKSRDRLEEAFRRAASKADRVGVIAPSVSEIAGIDSLCHEAVSKNVRLSFSSMRANRLTPEFLAVLKQSGVKTATIAPDAGSERMRLVINKGITEEEILDAAETLVAAGIPNLKLYFMIGLPFETMEDVEAIAGLCKQIRHRFVKSSRSQARIGRMIVSLNCFVPKPFTPFQWAPFEDIRKLKAKLKYVKTALQKLANVTVHSDVPKWAYLQALFSRGDRRIAHLLAAAHIEDWNWPKVLKASIINPDFYVYRQREVDEILPWDFIDHGIKKSFLVEEYRKAAQAKPSPPCHPGQCKVCGVC